MSQKVIKHRVRPDEEGLRLDQLLSQINEVPSRSSAQRWIKQQHVQINQTPADSPSRILRRGDLLEILIPPPKTLDLNPESGNLNILYEDQDLIVLVKPAGLVVHPSPGHDSGTMVNFLLDHCTDLSGIGGVTRPGIVHRLDKDTSGVMVAAKNDRTHQHLATQFKEHSVKRSYQALVWGKMKQKKGTIDAPLGRHPVNRKQNAIVTNGRRAITHWNVEQQFSSICLLKCRLETGRTHQIRVHLSSLGFPIVGDPLYGKSPRHLLKKLGDPLKSALLKFKRQALHAYALGFFHPGREEHLDFHHQAPDDFNNLLNLLSKEDSLKTDSGSPRDQEKEVSSRFP